MHVLANSKELAKVLQEIQFHPTCTYPTTEILFSFERACLWSTVDDDWKKRGNKYSMKIEKKNCKKNEKVNYEKKIKMERFIDREREREVREMGGGGEI